jgi:hypothetical protein
VISQTAFYIIFRHAKKASNSIQSTFNPIRTGKNELHAKTIQEVTAKRIKRVSRIQSGNSKWHVWS